MEINSQQKSIDQIVAQIQMLDLTPIKFKLMDAEEGYGWSREFADQNEIEYKRFLILLAKYPEASIAPSKNVDKFWHGHILDTLKYAEDCQNVFGYFLHHFPYFGMRGKEDAANLAAAANMTRQLYRHEFGDTDAVQASSYCGVVASGPDIQAASKQSSYCGVPSNVSFCGITTSDEHVRATPQQSGYCGATSSTSYCGVAVSDQDSQTERPSYCGIANIDGARTITGRAGILNTALRPSLPNSAAK